MIVLGTYTCLSNFMNWLTQNCLYSVFIVSFFSIRLLWQMYFMSDKNHRASCVDANRQDPLLKMDKTRGKRKSVPDRRIIGSNALNRLKSKAIVVTAEDRRTMVEGLMAERERLENESVARKQKLQSYDVIRAKGKRLTQVGLDHILIRVKCQILSLVELWVINVITYLY